MRFLTTGLLAALTTAALILGVAHLPGGERIAASLNHTAYMTLEQPVEAGLAREFAAIDDPRLRSLFQHLVILQIAERARQLPAEFVDVKPNRYLQANRGGIASPGPIAQSGAPLARSDAVNVPAEPAAQTNPIGLNPWAMILSFALGIIWVSIRRS